jgi:AhpD family alkylhydroperoxidase
MKLAKLTVVFGMLLSVNASAQEADGAYADIKKTLGQVPTFLKAFPEEAIAPAWEELKAVQLNPATALNGKTKELIGLAVAAQIPCRYCIYFHTRAAKLNGASDREIKEAILMSSLTRQWSTVLNGNMIDEAAFKLEAGKIFEYVKQPHTPQSIAIVDAASAERDITATLGRVPGFMKLFPPSGLAGAWREFKTVQLNPQSALPGKVKELIGLAVAAQIPCRYCTYFHTEAAKLNGANDTEIHEAIAMAAITRHWSTYLNGMQFDEAQFRREVDQIMAYVKKAAKVASR